MMVKKCLLFIMLAFTACDQLGQIPGDPNPTASFSGDIYPLYSVFDSENVIHVVFNGLLNDSIAQVSNFSLSGAGIVLLSAYLESSNVIALNVSNQSSLETYQLSIMGRQFLVLKDSVGTAGTPGDLDAITTSSNIITLHQGQLELKGYGADDQESPELLIFSPAVKPELNKARHEPVRILAFAQDNVKIAKVEYRIDSGPYVEVPDVNMSVNIDHLADGDHQLMVRLSDLRGNTTARIVDFNVYYSVTSYDISQPLLRANFSPGGHFTVKTVTGNSDVIGGGVRLISPAHTYGFVPMSKENATTWSGDIFPVFEDGGDCTIVALEVYTNIAGQHLTNYTTNSIVLYNNTIYISEFGNDNNSGTRLSPRKSLYYASSFARALGITNIKASGDLSSYNFNRIFGNGQVLDGGYSPDFMIHDPVLYPSKFQYILIEQCTDVKVQNITLVGQPGLYGLYSQRLTVSNCIISPSHWPLRVLGCQDVVITANEIKESRYSVYFYSSSGIFSSNSVHGINGTEFNYTPIYIYSSDVDLFANEIYDNEGTEGGALKLLNSRGMMYNNHIHDNTADVDDYNRGTPQGGAIYDYYSSYTISNNIIENNTSRLNAGGIYSYKSSSWIVANKISGNRSPYGHGGGLYLYEGNGSVSDNIISNNSARHYAGGMGLRHFTGKIYNNIIKDNSSQTHCGGVWYYDYSTSLFTNNVVMRNETQGYGGGLMIHQMTLPVLFSYNTISSNSANRGGGIWYYHPNQTPIINQGEISYNQNYGIYRYYTFFTPVLNNVITVGNSPALMY